MVFREAGESALRWTSVQRIGFARLTWDSYMDVISDGDSTFTGLNPF